MRAFKVEVNGKRICVAGVGTNGVLSAITYFVGSPARRGDLSLDVGGLFSESVETRDVIPWKPRERYLPDSKTNERNQKAYIRAAVKQFGWQLVTRPP
jgi:hypothetical protein